MDRPAAADALPTRRDLLGAASAALAVLALHRSAAIGRRGWHPIQDFLNVGPDGPHSPGFDKEASLFLIQERDILGVGVETVGTDAGQVGTFDPPSPITP